MRGTSLKIIMALLAVSIILPVQISADSAWRAPFDTLASYSEPSALDLSLHDALNRVAAGNPSFKAFAFQLQAANENLSQAGVRPNPEIEMEIEEFGWNAPGFSESEFTVVVSQEVDLFGQRGARKRAAKAIVEATDLQVRVSAFDLYLRTKKRYYGLAHAQESERIHKQSVGLAKDIVENIQFRLDKGAALESELLLAQLEEQRAQLELDLARQDVLSFEAGLVSLWNADPSGVKALFEPENDLNCLCDTIESIAKDVDSTRDIIQIQSEMNLIRAEKDLVVAEARPSITLSGGVKRSEVDAAKSFLFGVSFPIPLFDRNQGARKSLDAQLQSMKYELESERNEVRSAIKSFNVKLRKLRERHAVLDSLILPTARNVYQELASAYNAGRVPYSQLLEANRILNDLSYEHNNIILEIHEQIIEIEGLTGAVLYIRKES